MKFEISRADGRSNAQVIIDMTGNAAPGEVFTYEALGAELSKDTKTTYDRNKVRQIVAAAYPRLLKEKARALHNVRGVGYRIAPAKFHVTLANDRQSRANKQMERGLQTLQHVRWDEMDANQRTAHEGQLLIMGAMAQAISALERRQSAVEDAIRRSLSGESKASD